MTGKAQNEVSISDYIRNYNLFSARIAAENRNIRSPLTVTVPQLGSSPSSSTVGVTGDFLATSGASMLGPFALLGRQVLIDINNTIDISSLSLNTTNNESVYTSNIIFNLIASVSTQLDTIDGAGFDGQILIARGAGLAQTITQNIALSIDNIVGNGVDNIITVTVATGTGSVLSTDNKVNITGTATFDIIGTIITKTGADTFTYDLGSIGSATPDTNGQVLRGNIQTLDGNDIVVTGTESFQSWILIFDSTLSNATSNGLWRVIAGTTPLGGGGGLTEPVIFGINTLTPQTLPTTTTIAWNTNNPQRIILDRAVKFDFTNLPPNGSYEGILVIIDIDATGGFDSPIWPASVVNPPVISTTALSRFSVMLYTIDNGITVTHATSVGSSSSINQWSTFPAIQTVSMATNGMTGLTIANIVDTGGISRCSSSGDATVGLVLSTVSGGKFSIQDVITPVATFDDTTGLTIEDTHVINMNQNIINTIGSLQFDNTVTFTPLAVNTIGFDNATNAMKYNVALTTNIHSFQAAGELLASISRIGSNQGQLSIEAVVANILQANVQVFIADSSTDPALNGQFTRNGVDTKVVSGGVVRNFSDIGVPIDSDRISQDDSEVIVIDLGPGPGGLIGFTVDGVSTGVYLFDRFSSFVPINMNGNEITRVDTIEGEASAPLNIDVPTSGQSLNFQFQGVAEWTLSQSTLGGDSIVLNNSFAFNSSGVNPNNDGQTTRNVDSVILQSPTTQFQRVTTGTNSGELALVKVDAAPSNEEPIYQINFNLFDSPTTITYAQIEGGMEDPIRAGTLGLNVRANSVSNVNAILIKGSTVTTNRTFVILNAESRIGSDLAFQAPTGSSADLKIFPALQHLGIVVQDNIPFNVGSLGSLGIPVSGTLPTTDAQADGFFGDHKGFLGMFDNGSGTLTLFYRDVNGRWASSIGWTRDVLIP